MYDFAVVLILQLLQSFHCCNDVLIEFFRCCFNIVVEEVQGCGEIVPLCFRKTCLSLGDLLAYFAKMVAGHCLWLAAALVRWPPVEVADIFAPNLAAARAVVVSVDVPAVQ